MPTLLPHRARTVRAACTAARLALMLVLCSCCMWPAPADGIEMFTFYGDGSRIGLPSLEVPIEAYPGIPLRSDRLRARRRAAQMGPAGSVRLGPPGLPTRPGGITIRALPPQQPVPMTPPAQQLP